MSNSINIQMIENGTLVFEKPYEITDDGVTSILETYQNAANVAVNGTAEEDDVLTAWSDDLVNYTATSVKNFKTQQAIQAIPTINPLVVDA